MTFINTIERAPRSYVLRQGRMTPGQKAGFEQYWPLYGLAIPPEPSYYDWSEVFARQAPCVVEMGFGMGDSLIALASAFPEINFIGVEVHAPGVGRCLHQIHHHQLSNVKIFHADVKAVLNNAIAPHSIEKILLLFPDPWPKTRHQKRRIVQPAFVHQVGEKLKVGGFFHLATDWQHYAEHMLTVLEACESLENYFKPALFAPPLWQRVKTKYEQRGEKQNHIILDLVYRKK